MPVDFSRANPLINRIIAVEPVVKKNPSKVQYNEY